MGDDAVGRVRDEAEGRDVGPGTGGHVPAPSLPAGDVDVPLVLRLDRPAAAWTDAFPVGEGRLGAMVRGGTGVERLHVNDDTCWSGAPHDGPPTPVGPLGPDGAPGAVAQARRLLADGDPLGAEAVLARVQTGWSQAYQPLVDVVVEHPAADLADRADADGAGEAAGGYRRELDLARGVVTTTWTAGDGTAWRQEVRASHPDRALLLDRRTAGPTDGAHGTGTGDPAATAPGGEVVVRLTSAHPWADAPSAAPGPDGASPVAGPATAVVTATVDMPSGVMPHYAGQPELVRRGTGPAVHAAVALAVVADGPAARVDVVDGAVRVRGADRVRVLLTSASDHEVATGTLHGDRPRVVREALDAARAALHDLDGLPARQVADHAALLDRVRLDLRAGGTGDAPDPTAPDVPDVPDLPLDARLVRHAHGRPDPHLAVLAFQYGRYLTVAASRPGTLPMNLQGIWNAEAQPPWNSNYTININTEMNYWPVLVGDLAECHEPLLSWLDRLAAAGRGTARRLYDARGWVAHHNSDPWGFSGPTGLGHDSASWSTWPFGGVWLARHVVDHHDWTGDDAVLERHWPVVRGAALFLLDTLVELDDGTLGTSPSTSPENLYLLPDGRRASVGVSTTSDLAMARDLLEHVRRLAPVVGDDDEDLRAAVDGALERLPTERVAPDGRLAEWRTDVPDAEPEHRHQSHLYRVFPGTSIDPDTAPALAEAARRTLDARGPDSTGWSLAWRLALRARLRDPDGVAALVATFLHPVDADPADLPPADAPAAERGGVYRSLLCAHPPFQIDGNLGFTAGLAEALVQAHRRGADGVREVHLLPALPAAWPDGRVQGLRLRGGLRVVDLRWRDGRVEQAVLEAARSVVVDVREADRAGRRQVALAAGERVVVAG